MNWQGSNFFLFKTNSFSVTNDNSQSGNIVLASVILFLIDMLKAVSLLQESHDLLTILSPWQQRVTSATTEDLLILSG